MHKLLQRQLKRYAGFDTLDRIPDPWKALLGAVDEAYTQADADARLLERSLELSSQELLQANSDMRKHLLAMESAPDGMAILDQDGRYVYLNDAHVKIHGYDRAEELRGQTWKALYGPEELRRLEQEIMPLFWRQGRWRGEAVGRRRDGSLFDQEVSLAAIKSGGLICVVRDITERKQVAEALARQAEALARSNAELEQFAYVASHDLQEPLRMVASYVQLLARRYQGRLDADADVFITFAVQGANRMREMIHDLLAYSRVGTQGKAFEPVDTGALFDQVIANFELTVAETKAVVTRNGLPTVAGDAVQLGQVFQNLLSNALKFHAHEPPRVHVSSERAGDMWLLTVQDHGIGIDPAYSGRIFALFQRLHTAEEYPGTGIGLAICKKIVERHGGRIWVESALGKGATFHFTLPPDVSAKEAGTHDAVR